MIPLSHHEILRFVGPFTRADRHVDLANSDRATRVLQFKPVLLPVASGAVATGQLTELLRLDLSTPQPKLRRTVASADGLQTYLDASGADLDTVLKRVLAVPPETHFRTLGNVLIADSYCCPEDLAQPLILRESLAHVQGIEVALDARTVVGEPMSVTLTPSDAQPALTLPADLIAVLGNPWKLLRRREGGWKCLLYVPTREPKRTTVALARFACAMAHLDRVLASPPAAFHGVHRAARWGVWLRRLTPLAIGVAIIGSLPLIDHFLLSDGANMNPLIFGIPNFLIVGFIYASRHEMPSLELPSLPRPLATDAWPSANRDANAATSLSGSRMHG